MRNRSSFLLLFGEQISLIKVVLLIHLLHLNSSYGDHTVLLTYLRSYIKSFIELPQSLIISDRRIVRVKMSKHAVVSSIHLNCILTLLTSTCSSEKLLQFHVLRRNFSLLSFRAQQSNLYSSFKKYLLTFLPTYNLSYSAGRTTKT